MRLRSVRLLIGGIALLLSPFAASAGDPIPGIGPVGDVKQLHTDLSFTEGPAYDGNGNLYFSDIPANRIYRSAASGELSVAIEPSNHTNGLMFDGKGRLLACEMDGAVVAHNLSDSSRVILTGKYGDKRFNAPNDLVIDREGGIYFTDPRFRAPDPWPQGKEAFYYRRADGKVIRLGDNLPAPNGILLAPNEKTLYVVPSMQKEVMAYPVEGPGKLGEGRVFCSLKQPEDADNSGGDGLTVDTEGNLYITSRRGVQVFSPTGKLLGIVEFPEQPANVAFGGKDASTLFVTARTSVYSVEMTAKGHVFPGVLKLD